MKSAVNIFLILYTIVWVPVGMYFLLLAMFGFYPTQNNDLMILIANPIVVGLILKYFAK